MRFARRRFASLVAFALAAASAVAHAAPPPASASAQAPASAGALPWLGVSMDRGGDLGVRVETVVRGSPADRSGVRARDRIVAIDGARVTTPSDVTRAVAAHKIGDKITLGLERAGSPAGVAVVLGARPSAMDLLRMHLVGAPAPAWSDDVTPLSGAPASVAALQGKVVILDFWASWCGPCRMLAPRLSALGDRLGAQGLAVIGMTTDPAEEAAVFARRHAMRYPIVVDVKGETSRIYNVTALPTLVLVDRKGIVRDVVVGFAPDEIEVAVRRLLAEPAPPPR
jgi:thiol-disulfide isomerase/thioredoxin